MEFKIEINNRINDDFKLMADIYFELDRTTVCLYFPEVVENIDKDAIYDIIDFLQNIIKVKQFIEETELFKVPSLTAGLIMLKTAV